MSDGQFSSKAPRIVTEAEWLEVMYRLQQLEEDNERLKKIAVYYADKFKEKPFDIQRPIDINRIRK